MDSNTKEAIEAVLVNQGIHKHESILAEFKKLKPKFETISIWFSLMVLVGANTYFALNHQYYDSTLAFNLLAVTLFGYIGNSNRIVHKRLDLLEKLIRRSSSQSET